MGILESFRSSFKDFMFFDKESIEPTDDYTSQRASALNVRNASASAGRDPVKALAKKIALSLAGQEGTRDFVEPETDLVVIETAYQAEAYVRQGIDKYIDKMFKAGWKFVGTNTNTVDYIRTRFSYMAETTQIPTDKLFIEYAEDVAKFSNSIMVKARMSDQNQLPSTLSVTGYAGRQPVVGYFPLNVTTMSVKRDKFGTPKQWQQEVDDGTTAKFKPEDIIHTYYKRTKGNAFGTPFISPVLDDIRALRQAEDNVLKMMYRNINPFYHIKVGSEEYPADDPEISAAKSEVEGMEVDGGLVTSERWSINAIAADKVIDANPYLAYFENRVFTGLGVPATMFGRGATANKSTASNMDAEFVDRVKALQKAIEADVNEFMIKELLMEGGFDPTLNPDDMVYFKFNEIDIDMQVKLENHAVFKYEHNAITESEMRQLLGLDVITDRAEMFNELITLNKVRETYKAESQYDVETAKALAALAPKETTPSTSTGGSSSNPKSTKKEKEAGTPSTNNKVKPKNQTNPQGKEKTGKDSLEHITIEHLEDLNDTLANEISKYYDALQNSEDEARTQLQYLSNMISFKELFLADIYAQYDCTEQDKLRIAHTFKTIREQVASAISTTYNGAIARESALETVNCVFKVIQHTTSQYFNREA